MKKILCFCLCLVLLAAYLPKGAQAESPAITVDCEESYAAGETFAVDIRLDDIEGYCGIAFSLQYDNEQLEIISAEQGSAFASLQMVENLDHYEDKATFTFTGSEEKSISGVMVTVTFTAKSTADGDAEFAIVEPTAVAADASSLEISGGSMTVAIEPMQTALLTVLPASDEEGNLVLHVDMEDASYYCVLSFSLEYDNSRYEVVSAVRGSDFSGAMGVINAEYSENEIFVSTVYTEPTSKNGRLLTVTLKPIDGEAAAEDFSISIYDYMNANYEPLDIDWTFNHGTLTDVAVSSTGLSVSTAFINMGTEAKTCTVMMAVYDRNGKLRHTASETKTLSAGTAAEFTVSAPADVENPVVRLMYLNGEYAPLAPMVQLTFGDRL